MSSHATASPHRGDAKAVLSRRHALAATLGVIVLPAGLALAEDTKAAEVHIDNFAFTPQTLTIAPGTTVTWTNRDDIPHTIVEKGISFRSKPLDTDDKFTHTFDTPGEIEYFCSLHPHMTGKIIVKP